MSSSILTILLLLFISGCSIKKLAVNSLVNALSEGSTSVYATDDDPELVGEALPFALKTFETLLQSSPNHKGLLLSTASGFVQYAQAYVQQPADAIEFHDLDATRKGRNRARRLFIRARDYAIRALEIDYSGIAQSLNKKTNVVLSQVKIEDVPILYWTGVAWGSAISVSKDNMALVADVPIVRALLERALELNESWNDGAIHEFFVIFDAGRSEAEGGGIARAEKHFKRALELSEGRTISPLVTFAESVCIQQQDRKRFEALLTQALDFDYDKYPDKRLANILAQRKAADLLKNIDYFFYMDDEEFEEQSTKNKYNR